MPIEWGKRRLETPIARPLTPGEHHYASLNPLVELQDRFEKHEKTSDEISRLRGLVSTSEYENDCDGVVEWEGYPDVAHNCYDDARDRFERCHRWFVAVSSFLYTFTFLLTLPRIHYSPSLLVFQLGLQSSDWTSPTGRDIDHHP